jgi:hypothetical protein
MDDFDAAKQMIVAAMGELEGMRAELSALTTNVEDVKAMLDDALRSVCGLDVVADADRLMGAKGAGGDKPKYLGGNRDF